MDRHHRETEKVRPAAVAGTFYPGAPHVLRQTVDRLLAGVTFPSASPPKALLVPHAGYPYSGPSAAAAYATLRGARGLISRVVLIGPAHRVFVRGAALPTTSHFETPLGSIRIGTSAWAALADLPFVHRDDDAHAAEHALEVQLPFLSRVLGEFELLPIVVGQATPADVAQLLDRLWGGAETLIVVSSDLSHFESHASATTHDRRTIARILAYAEDLHGDDACGAAPLNGFLRLARERHLRPRLLDARNSGDTAGDRSRVVGYCAIAFEPAPAGAVFRTAADVESDELGHALLGLARARIAEALGLDAPAVAAAPALDLPGATFVTLTCEGQLRGCIGSLDAVRSRRDDVRANAFSAAFEDPRFAPVTRKEFTGLDVEVSLLSRPAPLAFDDEAGALAQLRPGVDGVVLEADGRRATFLPQVWAQLPTPQAFIAALKRKAGLPADCWSPDLRLRCYTVQKWRAR